MAARFVWDLLCSASSIRLSLWVGKRLIPVMLGLGVNSLPNPKLELIPSPIYKARVQMCERDHTSPKPRVCGLGSAN